MPGAEALPVSCSHLQGAKDLHSPGPSRAMSEQEPAPESSDPCQIHQAGEILLDQAWETFRKADRDAAETKKHIMELPAPGEPGVRQGEEKSPGPSGVQETWARRLWVILGQTHEFIAGAMSWCLGEGHSKQKWGWESLGQCRRRLFRRGSLQRDGAGGSPAWDKFAVGGIHPRFTFHPLRCISRDAASP